VPNDSTRATRHLPARPRRPTRRSVRARAGGPTARSQPAIARHIRAKSSWSWYALCRPTAALTAKLSQPASEHPPSSTAAASATRPPCQPTSLPSHETYADERGNDEGEENKGASSGSQRLRHRRRGGGRRDLEHLGLGGPLISCPVFFLTVPQELAPHYHRTPHTSLRSTTHKSTSTSSHSTQHHGRPGTGTGYTCCS